MLERNAYRVPPVPAQQGIEEALNLLVHETTLQPNEPPGEGTYI